MFYVKSARSPIVLKFPGGKSNIAPLKPSEMYFTIWNDEGKYLANQQFNGGLGPYVQKTYGHGSEIGGISWEGVNAEIWATNENKIVKFTSESSAPTTMFSGAGASKYYAIRAIDENYIAAVGLAVEYLKWTDDGGTTWYTGDDGDHFSGVILNITSVVNNVCLVGTSGEVALAAKHELSTNVISRNVNGNNANANWNDCSFPLYNTPDGNICVIVGSYDSIYKFTSFTTATTGSLIHVNGYDEDSSGSAFTCISSDGNRTALIGHNNGSVVLGRSVGGGGEAWTKHNTPLSYVWGTHVIDANTWIIGGEGLIDPAVYITFDQGKTWTLMPDAFTTDPSETEITGEYSGPSSVNRVFEDSVSEWLYFVTKDNELCKLNKTISSMVLTEFKTFDSQEFQVIHRKYQGTIYEKYWFGFIDHVQGYEENYDGSDKFITLRAIDYISVFYEKEYRDSNGDLFTGRDTLFNIVVEGLDQSNPDQNEWHFLTYLDARNEEMTGADWTAGDPTDAQNPLKQIYVDRSQFMHDNITPYTWGEVFETIGYWFNAFLGNNAEGFTLSSISIFGSGAAKDTTKYMEYLMNAGTLSGQSVQLKISDLNSQVAGSISNYGTDLRRRKAGEATRYIDFSLKRADPSWLIPRGNFEPGDWDGSTLKDWTPGASINYEESDLQINPDGFSYRSLKITSIEQSSKSSAQPIYAPWVDLDVGEGDIEFAEICISFAYRLFVASASPNGKNTPEIGISVQLGDNWLQDNRTWLDSSNVIWTRVSGDNMSSWQVHDLGPITIPSTGRFRIGMWECFDGELFGASEVYYDSVYCILYENNKSREIYKDLNIIGENTTSTHKDRMSLQFPFMDFPNLVFTDYSSAVKSTCTIVIGNPKVNGDSISLDLDGTTQTFAYNDSPSFGNEWSTIAELKTEFLKDSNNYLVEATSGDIKITTIDWNKANINPSLDVSGGSNFSIDVDTDKVDTSVDRTFVSRAAPSVDSLGNSPTTYKWYHIGNTGLDFRLHELIMYRYFRLLHNHVLFLDGTFEYIEDGAEAFTMFRAFLDGTDYYLPVNGEFDIKEARFKGQMMRIKDEALTTSNVSFKELWQGQ